MKLYIKGWLFIVALVSIMYGCSTAMAMGGGFRCGNSLVAVGDAQYTVIQACGEPIYTHRTGGGPNGGGDQELYYWKVTSNLTEEVVFIDGHVYEIHDIYN